MHSIVSNNSSLHCFDTDESIGRLQTVAVLQCIGEQKDKRIYVAISVKKDGDEHCNDDDDDNDDNDDNDNDNDDNNGDDDNSNNSNGNKNNDENNGNYLSVKTEHGSGQRDITVDPRVLGGQEKVG